MNFSGSVVSIHIGQRQAPIVAIPQVRALAGRGLEGDRFLGDESKPGRQVTLIESEALEGLKRDYGVELTGPETRRNILTMGVPLNHLVGREFRVGEVRLRGLRLCEPCEHLKELTKKEVLPGLVHRGGLRAEILSDGVIRVGDPVTP